MNADGSLPTQITNSKAADTDPAWSRDGKRIAFTRAMEGNSEIYVVNTDGSNEKRLTSDPAADTAPNWSPDGRIFFTSNRSGGREIYVMGADGSNVTRFTTIGATSSAWSPDGSKVAFVSVNLEIGKNLQLQVFVADADGTNIRNVTQNSPSTFVPCWSADGASIAFAVDNLGVVSNIFQVDLSNGEPRRLTAGPKIDAHPSISPDGSKLAFQSNRNGNFEIYVKNLR
jgi:Tol biopolymer transport system component